MADDERSEEQQRRFDRMLDPFDGPASENAYPEDPENDLDGSGKIMNDLSRTYNRIFGGVDEAADKPWTPKNERPPEGSASQWTEEQRAEHDALLAKDEALLKRFEEGKLDSVSQLPDLEGQDLEIVWDFEQDDEGEDDRTVLRHGERVIWREVGLDEAMFRFEQVIWILREKYGPRLASLTPTRAGLLQLRGKGYVAKPMIDELNEELALKREVPATDWTIEIKDADPDLPGPERDEEELKASVKEMGFIDCSCGWVGEATEARVIGTADNRDILCPDCRRPLYRLTLGE